MRRLLTGAAVLLALVTSVTAPGVQAGTEVDGPDPAACDVVTVSDPDPEADHDDLTGVVVGTGTTTAPGTLVCTIQVDAATHVGPDAAVREFASDNNGVIAGTQIVWFSSGPDSQVYMCMSFRRADGTTIYSTGEVLGEGARWHTDPTKPCNALASLDDEDVWDVIEGLAPGFGVAVLGYVRIDMSATATSPTVTVTGALADPSRWDCTWPAFVPSQPFVVTCDPVPATPHVEWDCAVLHAHVMTNSPAGRARAALDCNDDGFAEAETATAWGATFPDNYRYQVAVAGTLPVTRFRCRVDNGTGNAPLPAFDALCGDPGAVSPR